MSTIPSESELEHRPLVIRQSQSSCNSPHRSLGSVHASERGVLLVNEGKRPDIKHEICNDEGMGGKGLQNGSVGNDVEGIGVVDGSEGLQDDDAHGGISQQNDENNDDATDDGTSEAVELQLLPPTRANTQVSESDRRNNSIEETILGTESDGGPQDSTEKAVTADSAWRPTWLRAEVLAAFVGMFLVMTTTISVLLSLSEHNNGLWEVREDFAQAWRFGPTIVFTIIASLWGRVELQAMVFMPAIVIGSNVKCKRDVYTLDYTSMLSPMVLIRAIRQRHHLVFLTTLISLLLKAQVALAPGFLAISDIQVEKAADFIIQGSFDVTSTSSDIILSYIGDSSAYYLTRAMRDYGMLYPFGVNENVAYQTFEESDPSTGSTRGTVEAPTNLIVDGFFAEPHCHKLEHASALLFPFPLERATWNPKVGPSHIDLYFEGCDKPIRHIFPSFEGQKNDTGFLHVWDFAPAKVPPTCSTLPRERNYSTYLVGLLDYSTGNSSYELSAVAAILCSHDAWVEDVTVSDNGISPEVTLIPNARKKMVAANIWTLIIASLPRLYPFRRDNGQVRGPLAVDQYDGRILDPRDPWIYDNEVLFNSSMNLFRTISPFIGHYILRQTGNQAKPGSVILSSKRLRASQRVGISMATVFGMITFASGLILLRYGRKNQFPFWNRNPTTVFGAMVFFHQFPGFTNLVKCQDPNAQRPETNWSNCLFLPLVLRSWARAALIFFVVSLAVCLATTQQLSDSSQGLATITGNKEANMHLLWTSTPALVLLSISLYATSFTMALRALHTFWIPMSRACNSKELDQSLLDMLSIRAVYRSILSRSSSVTVWQLLSFICAALTTLASVLFTSKEFEAIPESMGLQQVTRFGTQPLKSAKDAAKTRTTLSSLLLHQGDANFTYPRNTYGDLIFPGLNYTDIDMMTHHAVSLNLTAVPAARLQSQCTRLPVHRNRTLLTFPGDRYFEIGVPFICADGTRFHKDFTFQAAPPEPDESYEYSYIGSSIPPGYAELYIPDCRPGLDQNSLNTLTSKPQTYLWGVYSWSDRDLSSLSVWQCNYEWFEVSTEVNLLFTGEEWELDPANPPRPDLSTLKEWEPPFGIPSASYSSFQGRQDESTAFPRVEFNEEWALGIEDQVALLVQPYGPFSLEALGDIEQEDAILASLRYNFGFVSAQLANMEYRIDINHTEGSGTDGTSDLPVVNATINYKPQLRLVQNVGPTCAIVAILLSVALVNTWSLCSTFVQRTGRQSRFFDIDVKGIAPEGFGSFAAMASLLRNSNVYAHLPPNIESFPDNELHAMLSHLSFRMGWFQNKKDSECNSHFTIGVLEDEDTVFLGGKRDIRTSRDNDDRENSDSL